MIPGPAVLALISAAAFGIGDFLGGIATRRLPLAVVLLLTRGASFIGVLVAALILGGAWPTGADWAWALVVGLTATLAIALLYWCLAHGTMSVVAPLTALCALGLPVVIGLVAGDPVSANGGAGIAAAAAAVVLISQTRSDPAAPTGPPERRILAGAIVAGLFFGLYFVGLKQMNSASGLWPVVIVRGFATLLCLGLVLHRAGGSSLRSLPLPMLALAFGTGLIEAFADAAYWAATRNGLLSIVAALTSLYPATTILMAMAMLGERLRLIQIAGLVLAALAGILLATA